MADWYKVLKADPLGEPWQPSQPGSKPVQNYWCQVEGQPLAVSVGRQTDNPLVPGQHIYGDLKYAKSQKGTEYWKFGSVKPPEGEARPADTPQQAAAQQATGTDQYAEDWAKKNASDVMPGWAITMNNMIKFIYQEMKKMSDATEDVPPTPQAKPEVVGGAPISPETQATLDAVFSDTPPEVPGE